MDLSRQNTNFSLSTEVKTKTNKITDDLFRDRGTESE
jgi:hypothetical protein